MLYNYTCPICNNSGHDAHTKKHCPYDPGIPFITFHLSNCSENTFIRLQFIILQNINKGNFRNEWCAIHRNLFLLDKLMKQRELAESLAQITKRPKDDRRDNGGNTCANVSRRIKSTNTLSHTYRESPDDSFAMYDPHHAVNYTCPAACDGVPNYGNSFAIKSCNSFAPYDAIEMSQTYAIKEPINITMEKQQLLPSKDKNIQQALIEPKGSFEECEMVMDESKVAYLSTLRNEFRNMPVITFYNILRLWQLQNQNAQNND